MNSGFLMLILGLILFFSKDIADWIVEIGIRIKTDDVEMKKIKEEKRKEKEMKKNEKK